MKTPSSLLPNLRTLTRGLTDALGASRPSRSHVRVLARTLPKFMSTFPNEIVTCRLPGGRRRRVFIKYGKGRGHDSFGHRGNVPYEAQVYQRLLNGLREFHPRCLGVHTDSRRGETWLLLEYAYGTKRVGDLAIRHSAPRRARPLMATIRWLGEFHAAHVARVGEPEFSFLKRYDADYYRGWAQRTFEFAQPLLGKFPWLAELRGCGDAWFAPLLAAPPTIIHGELYANAIWVRGERLFILDWESAAAAPGEIDLASLTEGTHWPEAVARRCLRGYERARWRGGTPGDFQRTLDAARIYLHFRWLGDRPEWATREKTLWRYEHLHAAAKRLELII